MSRSGYSEDCEDCWSYIRGRGMVASATRGKRGQAMLRELLEALDAMPLKELIKGDLVELETGACCAIGALLLHREVSEPERYHEDNESLADEIDVAEVLVQEVEWVNDEWYCLATSAERWVRMRAWVAKQIKEERVEGAGEGSDA